MKTFTCQCGNSLHFENTLCFSCGRTLGYLPDEKSLSSLENIAGGKQLALLNQRVYRFCGNCSTYGVCNWMIPDEDERELCVSCRLNRVIPNLSDPQNHTLWFRIEKAKRRLLYTLYSLELPVIGRDVDPEKGLAFEFLQDMADFAEFSNELTMRNMVMTGHSQGLITINVLEAEHSSREEMREKMNERYRTLLGHFRHESGHYYWERLINGTDRLAGFRELFGDERLDYQQALRDYYGSGPPPAWENNCISAYAASHPWEDWAETWAHYLHMADTLETAHDFGFQIHGYAVSAPGVAGQLASGYGGGLSFDDMFNDWTRLSVALNALNRSMGMADAYPFAISPASQAKLRYVHDLIRESGG